MSSNNSPPVFINDVTGEMINVGSYAEYKPQIKYRNGWTKLYPKEFMPMMKILIGGKKGEIIEYVLTRFDIDFTLQVTQKYIQEKFKVSESTVEKTFAKMKEAHLIKNNGKVFKLNPFAYIPPKTPPEMIAKAQQEWECI